MGLQTLVYRNLEKIAVLEFSRENIPFEGNHFSCHTLFIKIHFNCTKILFIMSKSYRKFLIMLPFYLSSFLLNYHTHTCVCAMSLIHLQLLEMLICLLIWRKFYIYITILQIMFQLSTLLPQYTLSPLLYFWFF